MALEAKASSENIPKGMRRINPVKGILRFIKETRGELKRITWPSKDKIIRSTTVVLTSVILITGIIWLIDSIFNVGLGNFLKLLR